MVETNMASSGLRLTLSGEDALEHLRALHD